MKVLFTGGAVYDTASRQFVSADILTEDGIILDISEKSDSSDARVIDCTGQYILPGLVDVHTHGRAGYDFNSVDEDAVFRMRKSYAAAGTTTLMATLASDTPAGLEKSISVLNSQREVTPGTATLAGIHLEGRYLNPGKRGAHAEGLIAPLDAAELASFIRMMQPLPVHISAAVEMEGGEVFTAAAQAHGATVSLAHSNATYAQARRAVEMGVRSFTHTFNTMRPVHHREPGNAVAALLSDEAYAEFICDGEHLHPAMLKLAVRCKPADRFLLITDSMEATGCPDGEYSIAGQKVFVKNGLAVNEEGAIAGSTLDLFRAVCNMMRFCDMTLEEVLPFATANPADMLGIAHLCGRLLPGLRADFILIENKEHPAIASVWCAGEQV